MHYRYAPKDCRESFPTARIRFWNVPQPPCGSWPVRPCRLLPIPYNNNRPCATVSDFRGTCRHCLRFSILWGIANLRRRSFSVPSLSARHRLAGLWHLCPHINIACRLRPLHVRGRCLSGRVSPVGSTGRGYCRHRPHSWLRQRDSRYSNVLCTSPSLGRIPNRRGHGVHGLWVSSSPSR